MFVLWWFVQETVRSPFFEIKRWRSARDGRSNPRLINRLTVISDIPNISAVSRTLNAKRRSSSISLASL